MMKTEVEKQKNIHYMFYADCHGLISLVPMDPVQFELVLVSIQFNEQRWGVAGTIELDELTHSFLTEMLNTDEGKKEALNLIKKHKYNLPSSKVSSFQRRLESIPNDSLDPYWSKI